MPAWKRKQLEQLEQRREEALSRKQQQSRTPSTESDNGGYKRVARAPWPSRHRTRTGHLAVMSRPSQFWQHQQWSQKQANLALIRNNKHLVVTTSEAGAQMSPTRTSDTQQTSCDTTWDWGSNVTNNTSDAQQTSCDTTWDWGSNVTNNTSDAQQTSCDTTWDRGSDVTNTHAGYWWWQFWVCELQKVQWKEKETHA